MGLTAQGLKLAPFSYMAILTTNVNLIMTNKTRNFVRRGRIRLRRKQLAKLAKPFVRLRAERERRLCRSRVIIIGIQLHCIWAAGKPISSFAVFACFCSKSSLLLAGLKDEKPEDLRLRTKKFALDVIRLYAALPKSTDVQVLALRSPFVPVPWLPSQ